MAKNIKAAIGPDKTYVTLKGLQVFKSEYDKKLNGDIANHTHIPDQITETETKKFVAQTEKNRWNDTYTKAETDGKVTGVETKLTEKIDALEKARVWKPSVGTFDDIATTYPEPQDTWCVIAKDTNIMWMYDAEQQKWIDLGHSVIHDNATTEKDGLMSKEDKAKLDGMEQSINAAKEEVTQKVTELSTKHDQEKQALEQSISSMDAAYKAEDTKIRGEINTAKEEVTNAYQAADTQLDGKITNLTQTHTNDKAELEKKIQDVDAKFIAATDEQIKELFTA